MYCTVLRKIYAKEYNVTVSSKILQTVNSEGVSSVVKTKAERKNGRIASHGKTRLKVSNCGSVVSILVELTLPFWNLEMLTAYTVDNFTIITFFSLCVSGWKAIRANQGMSKYWLNVALLRVVLPLVFTGCECRHYTVLLLISNILWSHHRK